MEAVEFTPHVLFTSQICPNRFPFYFFCSIYVFGTASKIYAESESKAAAETVPFTGDRQS